MRIQFEETSDEPLYNIGIVSKMTGIAVATLRVWERRYGFPSPARTGGGHRLCSEREIIRLRWVKARVDEGMQTAQAIRALQYLESEGRMNEASVLNSPQLTASSSQSTLETFHTRLTDLLIKSDLAAADQLLGEVTATCSVDEVILEVIGPTLNDIGQAWEDQQVSIAVEHLATHFLRQRILHWMITGPVPYAGAQPILLACAPNEWHEGSLLMFGALMRRRRWPIAYLGQNVPLVDLDRFVREMRPSAIVFVAMHEESALSLIDWSEHIPESQQGRLIVGYGGRIFTHDPSWRDRMRGIFLGETLKGGVDRLDAILRQQFTPLL